MRRRIFQIGVTAFVFWTQAGFAQQAAVLTQEDVQSTIHKIFAPSGGPSTRFFKGEEWEADKTILSKYSQDQLASALIAELDVDYGTLGRNHVRDKVVQGYFNALQLPPTPLCQELDKADSPERKLSLMFILRGRKEPEVTQALLRQLKDRRPAGEPPKMELVEHIRAPRVCDEACNTLLSSLRRQDSKTPAIEPWKDDEHRDKQIKNVLQELKLTAPN